MGFEQLETAKKRMNKNDESKAAAEGEIETVKGAKATSETSPRRCSSAS